MNPTTQDNAPIGAVADVSPQWPAEHEWPAADAPATVHVRFLRDRLGLRCYPTPNAADIAASAKYIYVNAVADWKADRGGADMTAEECVDLLTIAEAEAAATSKGPLALTHQTFTEASAITDAMVDRAWGGKHTGRGIAVALGRSTKGFPLAQLDVDPRHGGAIDGPLVASLTSDRACSMTAVTPGGGLHIYVLGESTLRPQVSGALAPGVELRTTGYAMMPSGSSSAGDRHLVGGQSWGRAWVSTGRPQRAPESLRKAVHRVGGATGPRAAPVGGVGGSGEGDDGPLGCDTGSGRATLAISSEVGDGERNASAAIIVGLLARPGAVPEDARAALMLALSEHLAGRDAPASVCRETAAEWMRSLTRGPRDASFAADVIEVWAGVRDQSPRPWRASKARAVARSLWRTADRRLGGEAGAEDLGEGPPLGVAPSWVPSPPPHPAIVAAAHGAGAGADVPVASSVAPAPSYAIGGPTPEQAVAALAATVMGLKAANQATGRKAVDLARLFVPLGEMYGAEDMARDEARKPVRVAKLPPFIDFLQGGVDESYPYGYGMGPWFARGLGGLVAGDMKAYGAPGAKGGKTYLVGQMLDGLALQTAHRIMGTPGYEDAPYVLVFWVSEMSKKSEVPMRFVARALGYDAKVTTQGVDAFDSVSLAALRSAGNMSPESYVKHARALRAWHQNPGLDAIDIPTARGDHNFMARDEHWAIMEPHLALRRALLDCSRVIDMSELPDAEGHGRGRIIHDGGPRLVGYVAESMAMVRSEFATRHGIAEADVLCVVCCDPAQRFSGDDGHDSVAALNGMLRAWAKHVAVDLGGAVTFTSDTTKGAVNNMDLGRFCHEDPRKVIAEVFAGSYALSHECDCIAIMAETTPDTEVTGRALMRARVLSGRSGASSEIYPFSWELHTGRFRPMDPKSVPIPEREDRPGFGSGGGGGRSGGPHPPASSSAPLGIRPAKNQPLRPPPRYPERAD